MFSIRVIFAFAIMLAALSTSQTTFAATRHVSVADRGAVDDAAIVNTDVIQRLIDELASTGGGTVVIPSGTFISGALDFRPGVHLHLAKDAVLRAAADVAAHFPLRLTRIEGQLRDFTPALINADYCDGFRLTGDGVLDGAGRAIWDEFWRLRAASPDPKNFPNLAVPRARLVHISRSRDVLVEGVTLKDSQFWNLHIYLCRDVAVRGVTLRVPDDYKQAPSTDGIDIDSSQDVLIERCTFSVTDDAIAMKGTKGPRALDDLASPPVERVTIRDCTFRRAHAALTCGSEATIVRDVVLENSRVIGSMAVLHLKLRTDTPQTYERIKVCDLVLEATGGTVVSIRPWTQYAELSGQALPGSIVRGITVAGLTGRFGSLGGIRANPDQVMVSDFIFRDITLRLEKPLFDAPDVDGWLMENVVVNGAPLGR